MLTKVVLGSLSYIRSNPLFLMQAARNAARMEISLPLDVLRWAIDRRPRGKGPERIDVSSAGAALGLGLTVDLYGTKIDVSSRISVESIENLVDQLRVALRISDLDVKAPAGSPAAMMVSSLDLSRPGNLVNMMPQKHASLVEANGDRFVLDLLKIPALGKNRRLKQLLSALSFVQVREVRTDGDVLVIGLAVRPTAIPEAIGRLRGA